MTTSDDNTSHNRTTSITVSKPLRHFTVTTTPTSTKQVSGVTDPFNMTVTALDVNNHVVTNYNSTSVTVTSNNGTLSPTPATCGSFSNGVCTLLNMTLNAVTIPTTQNALSVTLTASDN